METGAGCEGVMPLTSASGRALISLSRGCQGASVAGASTSSKLVFSSSRRGSSWRRRSMWWCGVSRCLFGISIRLTFRRASILVMSARFSFRR
ncbi:hypothetical protein D3C73_1362050 [compost metagenome]